MKQNIFFLFLEKTKHKFFFFRILGKKRIKKKYIMNIEKNVKDHFFLHFFLNKIILFFLKLFFIQNP